MAKGTFIFVTVSAVAFTFVFPEAREAVNYVIESFR
jgi:hypothetical protein